MSGMDRLPDSILEDTIQHATAPLYAAMARELLAHRRASQAAHAPSEGLREENKRLRALVDYAARIFMHCTVTDSVCCCGDNMEGHSDPMSCGHSPVDRGSYAVDQWCKQHAAISASPAQEGDRT